MTDPAVVVIGVGNALRGDDAVGLEVASQVGPLLPGSVAAYESSGEMSELIALWTGAARVILVDAIAANDEPGRVVRLEAGEQPISLRAPPTTHRLGLGEAIELARATGDLPRRVVVFGIEVERCNYGEELSGAVANAVPVVVEHIVRELCTSDI